MKLFDKTIETIYDGQGPWYVADQRQNGQKILLVKYNGAKQNEFVRLGLTDAVLLLLSIDTSLILLTTDLGLYLAATKRGLKVVNFNHHREANSS